VGCSRNRSCQGKSTVTFGIVELHVKFNNTKIIGSICLVKKTSGSFSCWRDTKYCVHRVLLCRFFVGSRNSLIPYVDNNVILLSYVHHCRYYKYWKIRHGDTTIPSFQFYFAATYTCQNYKPGNITLDTQK
jgi:hypothetical protein